MSPRLLVGDIYNRIEQLDFGYESDTSGDDIWNAALDIAITAGLITAAQRQRIESEDRNTRTITRWADRLRAQLRWEAMTPEQQERERWMRDSLQAQSKVIQDAYYWSVMDLAFKVPGV